MGRSWYRGMTGDLGWVCPFFFFGITLTLLVHVSSSFLLLSLFSFHQHSVLSVVRGGGGLAWDGSGAWDH